MEVKTTGRGWALGANRVFIEENEKVVKLPSSAEEGMSNRRFDWGG
jgi:hypothetical protein